MSISSQQRPAVALLDRAVTPLPGHRAELGPLSVTIEAGTLTVVRGANGRAAALLGLLTGEREPARGQVVVGGHPVPDRATDPAGWRRQIGHVSSRPVLLPYLSVRESVAVACTWARGRPPRGVDRLIELMGLGAVASALPSALDPQDRHLAAVARSLAFDPHVLVVESPPDEGAADATGPTDEPWHRLDAALLRLVQLDARTLVTSLLAPALVRAADLTLDLDAAGSS